MSASSMVLMDAAGRRRSPATTLGYLAGRAPHNKGMQYPPDPPRPEEIIVVMRQAGHDRHGLRLRALIAVLWRAGLRISEALALNETRHRHRPRLAADPSRQGRQTPRSRNGPVRLRATRCLDGAPCLAARRPALLRDRRPDPWPALGRDRRSLRAAPRSRLRRASVAGSHRISCATRTRSSSRARVSQLTSSTPARAH
jgi:integrase